MLKTALKSLKNRTFPYTFQSFQYAFQHYYVNSPCRYAFNPGIKFGEYVKNICENINYELQGDLKYDKGCKQADYRNSRHGVQML